MPSTQQVLNEIVLKLYKRAAQRYRLRFNPFSTNYHLQASDGQFLGNFGNIYDPNSIFNRYGSYGSIYSSFSIFNRYGNYGSRYSALSPYNIYSSTPPKILDENGNLIGYLSANKYTIEPLDPNSLITKAANDMGYGDRAPELIREY